MILRRLFTLTALALAVSLGLSNRASANFDVSTSVVGVNDPGGTLAVFNPATSFTNSFLSGTTTVSTPNGYTSFIDAGGSTVYLANQVLTNQGTSATSNERVIVGTNSGATDSSTWVVSLLISVTNPTGGSSTSNFGTGTVAEVASFAMTPGSPGGFSSASGGTASLLTPTTITVGGNSFTISNGTNSGANNNATLNIGGIQATIGQNSAVPEPASMVMLGSGLVGVIGLDLRRRRRRQARMSDSIRT